MEKRTFNSGGKFLWFFQRLSGFVLLLLLLLHTYISHFTFQGGAPTYSEVMTRLGDPYWKLFDLLFLYLALFHGLNGLWTVLTDYFHKPFAKLAFFSLITLGGLMLLIFGTITVISLPSY